MSLHTSISTASNNLRRALCNKLYRRYNIHPINKADWNRTVSFFKSRCAYCNNVPKQLTKEHLKSFNQSGSMHVSNIVPICKKCQNREAHVKSIGATYWKAYLRKKINNQTIYRARIAKINQHITLNPIGISKEELTKIESEVMVILEATEKKISEIRRMVE